MPLPWITATKAKLIYLFYLLQGKDLEEGESRLFIVLRDESTT